jgi:hypothetical protein
MIGWLTHSEIAHAVADRPEGPFHHLETVLKGSGNPSDWDARTNHNPTIHQVEGKYFLFYMGNSDPPGDKGPFNREYVGMKRIGVAVSDSLDGPWTRSKHNPLISPDCDPRAWDSWLVSNPSFLKTPEGEFRLYYKGTDRNVIKSEKWHRGYLKYGVARSNRPEGPYLKHPDNPIIDYAPKGHEVEDAYVFREAGGRYRIIMRDMGVFSSNGGIIQESDDGLNWVNPQVAYHGAERYLNELNRGRYREGQLERPQLLFQEGKPTHLFTALVGGAHGTSSGFVFKIDQEQE